jgi:hypothetical protein
LAGSWLRVIEEYLRRLFRNVPAAEAHGKEIDAQQAIRRRVEITVERQTVSVLHSSGVVQVDGETRCLCCGQVVPAPLSVCSAHEMDALSGEISSRPDSEKQDEK